MRVDRELFLLLTTAMAACHRDAAVVAPTTAPSTHPSAAAVDPDEACALTLQANRVVIEHVENGCPAYSEPKAGHAKLRALWSDKFLHYCKRDRHGAWAVVLSEAKLTAPSGEGGTWCGAEVSYRIARLEPNAPAAYEAAATVSNYADSQQSARIDAQYDLDGDGRDELFIAYNSWFNGGGNESSASVLQSTSGRIGSYPVGFAYDRVEDADGDGRPDLVNDHFYSAIDTCAGLNEHRIDGPSLLVHALPNGSFTMGDEIARRWAIRECPNDPGKPPYAEGVTAGCARLWGHRPPFATTGTSTSCDVENPDTLAELVKPNPPFKTLEVDTPKPLPTKKTPKP